jgi:hypothetical protein
MVQIFPANLSHVVRKREPLRQIPHKRVEEVDSWMEDIWLNMVRKEYAADRILDESNLHSTTYFHLRKLIESSKSKKTKPFIYSEMPFSATMSGEGKKYPRVDLAVVILEKDTPIDLLAAIELKHYETHCNSIGVNKDLDHLKSLRKGVYYPYKPTKKLIPRRAYFLYLVDKGNISFDSTLQRKIDKLKQDGYLKVFLGEGEEGKFYVVAELARL